uniref:Reverse transcriptase domain-containing protein n=1 Tax=Trichogramma kaykai TaxID=54128 RepID=A0ABD2X0I8_9HYME
MRLRWARSSMAFASYSLTPRVAGWGGERRVVTNSDHRAITSNLSDHRPHRGSAGPRRRWSARTLDEEVFSERLSGTRIPYAMPERLEDMAGALITAITEACGASMSSGGGRCHRRREPVYWWTDEIAALRRQCLRARRLAQRARGRPVEDAWRVDFAVARGRLRAAIEESKRRCWSAFCDEVDRDVWGRPYATVMSRLRGPMATPPREPSLVRWTVATLFPTVTEGLIRPPAGPAGAEVPDVSLEELRGAAARIRDGAAPGPDGVPNRALKLAVAVLPDAFLQVYSACLSGGVFPSPWKRQRLVLLLKPGKPPDAPSSYRPLCMLDTAGKILERIICGRLEVYTEAPAGLSDCQHGFRRGRSTIDAIESVTTAAREAVGGAIGSRKYCAVVTLDVRNAFNSARWNNILAALERIRTPEYLLKIIYSYFQAKVLEYHTDDGPESCSITAGVQQGSVLGPILWNVMYDSILRLKLEEGVRIVGFADDIAVVAEAGTTYEVEDILNRAIARVRDALWGLGLETADHKTEVLLLSKKRRLETITIEVGDCFIASSPCIRYLGLQLDARLTFNDHLRAASEKASRVVGALSQIMPTIGGPRSSRRRLYANVIDSILLYGAPIWSCGTRTRAGMRRAEAIHRRACLRVISGRPHLSYDATYVLASIPPLALLADERSRLYRRRHEDARAEERQETLRRWQSRWDRSSKGRWTHRLIPNVRSWIERRHGEVDYHLTQLLTGHGYFKHHSQRYDVRSVPTRSKTQSTFSSIASDLRREEKSSITSFKKLPGQKRSSSSC